MSNGQPPFPPPNRPNFPPGGPPPTLPPFPPRHPPPFPPTGSASPLSGARPPYPPPPPHYGLGFQSQQPGLPPPPHQAHRGQTSIPRKDVKTTKVFVGSIAPGIKDHTLKDLLNACGPLHELKRVEGANGQPQPFAFAMFENPEVVLRCIRCLNGAELPDMSPEGRRLGNRPKPLIVKADQKTAEFLKEFEDTLGRSASDDNADAMTRRTIANIIQRLTDPSIQPIAHMNGRSGRHSPIHVVVPAHLQDLKEGDLPEAQRVAVLDQIAIFRENAARREREKNSGGDDRDRFQQLSKQAVGYGYGTRAFPKADVPKPSAETAPSSSANGSRQQGKNPQGYSDPVSFVRPETLEGKGSERTDEEEETLRQQRRERDQLAALREREKRVESRERMRVDTALKEDSDRRRRKEDEATRRADLAQQLLSWDDDDEEVQRKSLFASDRAQWRQQRAQQRFREEQDDLEDRRLEDTEKRQLEAESEDFLQRQTAELLSFEDRQRRAGLLAEDAAPIKVAIAAQPIPEVREEPLPAISLKAKPAVIFGDDDEDEEKAIQRKKRAFVKLDYDAAADKARPEYEDAEDRAKQTARLLDISKHLSTEKDVIFSMDIDWEAIDAVKSKLDAYIRRRIAESLGELDADVAEFVAEQLSLRTGPRRLAEELDAVLAEEAGSFTLKVWRQLVFESLAARQGLHTGSMTV